MTEKETEVSLESEARTLTLPNGEQRVVRCFKVLWQSFDLLQQANMFTEARLINLSWRFSQRKGIPFEEGLASICGYAHLQAKRF